MSHVAIRTRCKNMFRTLSNVLPVVARFAVGRFLSRPIRCYYCSLLQGDNDFGSITSKRRRLVNPTDSVTSNVLSTVDPKTIMFPMNLLSQRRYLSRYARNKPITIPSNNNTNNNNSRSLGDEDTNRMNEIQLTNYTNRNKELQAVIREGYTQLHHTSSWIRKNPNTQKSILNDHRTNNNNDTDPNEQEDNSDTPIAGPNQLAEQHRLYTVAHECLEVLCEMNPTKVAPLMIHGEPITIVAVHVRPSLRYADLYWTIPSNILLDENLTIDKKIQIQSALEKRLELYPSATGFWIRRVYTVLSGYYPPKLRLKPATPVMIQQTIHEFEND